MKLKKYSICTLILGFVISLLGFITPFIRLNFFTQHNGAIGIIGGADSPSAYLLTLSLFPNLHVLFILLGLSLIIPSAFCLLFSKTVKTHLRLSTSAVSLGLSAVGALGILCAFVWLITVAFEGPSTHPVEYGVSILLGIFCFFAFIILIGLYIKLRKANKSVKGIIIDVLTSIVYLPFFFYLFMYLYEIVS